MFIKNIVELYSIGGQLICQVKSRLEKALFLIWDN